MTTPDDGFDWCVQYRKLRDAYNGIMEGGAIKRVRLRTGEDERETEFTTSNAKDLKVAMDDARRKCEASLAPDQPRRYAIGIGCPIPPVRRIY